MTGNFFFEFEKKNLLIASKAPQCVGRVPGTPAPFPEGAVAIGGLPHQLRGANHF